jgi:hypothetical protein
MKKFGKFVDELIEERLMSVDNDVDMIYDYYFKNDIEKVKVTNSLIGIDFEQNEYNTNFLKSPLAKKANKINPCKIFINIGSNHYNPKDSVIALGVSNNAVDFVLQNFNGNLNKAILELKLSGDKKQSINLSNEFSESKIKGSIHHELAHWIDDTLHNRHIKLRSDKAAETGSGMTKRGLPINADKIEIQGQIHNVVQLKKEYSDIWDSLTFEDLLKLSTTLNLVNNQLRGYIRTEWKRNLLTRMYREGLLGKNMI